MRSGARTTLLLCLFSAACAAQGPTAIPLQTRRTAPIAAAYAKVVLQGVYGNEQTDVGGQYFSYRLPKPMTRILEDAIRARLPSGGPGSIPLVVENVHWAVANPVNEMALGVGADFVLGAGPKSVRLKLEHTVNAPVGGQELFESLLARAINDLTDRFFFHPKALAQVEAGPELPQDSALADEPVKEVGPILGAQAASKDIEGSGRLLWGTHARQTYYNASILLGDSKGIAAIYNSRESGKFAGYRVNFGGIFIAGDSPTFGFLTGLSAELGYNGIQHDRNGYVVAPGISLLAVPTIQAMQLFVPDADVKISVVTMGGNLEFDLPIGTILGIRGGAFLGTAFYGFQLASTSDAGFSDFIAAPFGDIYIQTSTGRVSLGISFQQLASGTDGIKDQFENPTINLSYQAEAGRGVAYEKENVDLPGWGMTSADVKTGPRSVFTSADAMRADAPPGGAPVQPIVAVTAPPPTTTTATTASTGRPLWLLVLRDPDPEVGSEARYAARAVLEEVIRDAAGDVVSTTEEQRLRTERKIAEGHEGGLALAFAARARYVLYYSVTLTQNDALLRLERVQSGSSATLERQKLVARAAMLDALRDEAKALAAAR